MTDHHVDQNEFVRKIVCDLVDNQDEVEVESKMDEKGILITLKVSKTDLGRIIGKKGSTAQSIRTLLRCLGSRQDAHYALKIQDDKE